MGLRMNASWQSLFVACLWLVASSTAAQRPLDDGPHVQRLEQGLEAVWSCDGRVERRSLAAAVGTVIPALCGYPRTIVLGDDVVSFPVATRFTATRLAALSDVHGQFGLMRQLLRAHGVIDDAMNWQFGDGHLLVLGDVMDRGAQVTEALWLLYQLDAQARQAGGRLHMLLGNHETMVMMNDLRYVHPKYMAAAQAYGRSYPELINEQSVLGRWLRSKPVIVQVNDSLFMHAGLHPGAIDIGRTPAEINERFRQSLNASRPQIRMHPALSVLYGSLGPIWYRGYFNEPQMSGTELTRVLDQMQVSRIVVGHTTMSGIFAHHGARVLSIDADMRSGKTGELLLYADGSWQRGTLAGERLPIPDAAKPSDAPP